MSRTLSSTAIAALNASETGTVFIPLLTITHPSLAAPIYISGDPTTRKYYSDTTITVGSGDTDIGSDTDNPGITDTDTGGTTATMTIPAYGQPYYVTTSRGNDYLFVPFQLVLPDDREDQPGMASLEVDDINRAVTTAIRNIGTSPASVLIELVTNVTPDIVEGSFALVLRDVSGDAMTVSGRLGFEEILAEPFPPNIVTPATLPGVFAIQGN